MKVPRKYPFYILAVVRHKEPDLERPFKVPGYPLVPLPFLLGALALLWGALFSVDNRPVCRCW